MARSKKSSAAGCSSRRESQPATENKKRSRESIDEDNDEDEDADSVLDLTKEKISSCIFSTSKKKARQQIISKKMPDSIPLTITANAGKEGKQSMIVELASVELANDTGAIGRLNLRGDDLRIDVKGFEHAANIRPCKAMLLVSLGAEEAKIDSIVSEYVAITRTDDALAYLGEAAVVHGEVDDSFHKFQNDVDVNARQSKANGHSSSDCDNKITSISKTTKSSYTNGNIHATHKPIKKPTSSSSKGCAKKKTKDWKDLTAPSTT
mmetsp:Transcript_3988/g.5602  ORF Transcript_3988/g.5602 Transcript_3988/m.5602 type:complete len:265 (-) Transcript_3988:58-852(-)|eukprot:CAMPEP_0197285862 /NCGR_PEP_ID=MMETSP0890-20130614/1202_1 /TAXON_ID=44058 ORGANISM="Aureoumbra lagunensis, Strain CCMP1510" /NCGR_SAMPLE_ID=MMETSP0890 /ASSEMBLY_ACC=CAM_ASM_000533 /LENGTH=264 /DNA_ID=CAMNT_0042753719 /DNA_START=17 /DNA_END=811 /DNA_ORIENTATION=-